MRGLVVVVALVALSAALIQAADVERIAVAKCSLTTNHVRPFPPNKMAKSSLQGEFTAWKVHPTGSALEKWQYATRSSKGWSGKPVTVGVGVWVGSTSLALQFDASNKLVVYCKKVKDAALTRTSCGSISLKVNKHTMGKATFYTFQIKSPSRNRMTGFVMAGARPYMNVNLYDSAGFTGKGLAGVCAKGKVSAQLAAASNMFIGLPAKYTKPVPPPKPTRAQLKHAAKLCKGMGRFFKACRADVASALAAKHKKVALKIRLGYQLEVSALRKAKAGTTCDAKSKYQCQSYGCKKEKVCNSAGKKCHTRTKCKRHKCKCVLKSVSKKAHKADKAVDVHLKKVKALKTKLKALNTKIKAAKGNAKLLKKLTAQRRALRRKLRKARHAYKRSKKLAHAYHHKAWIHFSSKAASHAKTASYWSGRIAKAQKKILALQVAIAGDTKKMKATTKLSLKMKYLQHQVGLKKKLKRLQKALKRYKAKRDAAKLLAAAHSKAAAHHKIHTQKYNAATAENAYAKLHALAKKKLDAVHKKLVATQKAHKKNMSTLAVQKRRVARLQKEAKSVSKSLALVKQALLLATGKYKLELNRKALKLIARAKKLKDELRKAHAKLKLLKKRHHHFARRLSSLHSSYKKAKQHHTKMGHLKIKHSLEGRITRMKARIITLTALRNASKGSDKKKYEKKLKAAQHKLKKLQGAHAKKLHLKKTNHHRSLAKKYLKQVWALRKQLKKAKTAKAKKAIRKRLHIAYKRYKFHRNKAFHMTYQTHNAKAGYHVRKAKYFSHRIVVLRKLLKKAKSAKAKKALRKKLFYAYRARRYHLIKAAHYRVVQSKTKLAALHKKIVALKKRAKTAKKGKQQKAVKKQLHRAQLAYKKQLAKHHRYLAQLHHHVSIKLKYVIRRLKRKLKATKNTKKKAALKKKIARLSKSYRHHKFLYHKYSKHHGALARIHRKKVAYHMKKLKKEKKTILKLKKELKATKDAKKKAALKKKLARAIKHHNHHLKKVRHSLAAHHLHKKKYHLKRAAHLKKKIAALKRKLHKTKGAKQRAALKKKLHRTTKAYHRQVAKAHHHHAKHHKAVAAGHQAKSNALKRKIAKLQKQIKKTTNAKVKKALEKQLAHALKKQKLHQKAADKHHLQRQKHAVKKAHHKHKIWHKKFKKHAKQQMKKFNSFLKSLKPKKKKVTVDTKLAHAAEAKIHLVRFLIKKQHLDAKISKLKAQRSKAKGAANKLKRVKLSLAINKLLNQRKLLNWKIHHTKVVFNHLLVSYKKAAPTANVKAVKKGSLKKALKAIHHKAMAKAHKAKAKRNHAKAKYYKRKVHTLRKQLKRAKTHKQKKTLLRKLKLAKKRAKHYSHKAAVHTKIAASHHAAAQKHVAKL